MRFKINFLVFYIFLISSNISYSQYSVKGIPISLLNSENITKLNIKIKTIKLPYIDNDKENERADSISSSDCLECENEYFGTGIDLSINIKNNLVKVLDDGSKLWVSRIESTTALGMQFYFDEFELPKGAKLFLFNENGTQILGAYTSLNNPKNKTQIIKFGTEIISGNTILIEYHEPKNASFEGKINITKIIHVYNKHGPFVGSGTGSGSCNINVNCPQGDGWDKEVRSVALILKYDPIHNLSGHCSGALINNTNEDGRPFFLTANHCIVNPSQIPNSAFDWSTWTFLFNHQTINCNSDGSELTEFIGESVYGSTLLSSDDNINQTSDFALLELNTSAGILSNYNVCYAGWSTELSHIGKSVGIHHPSGDVKKISIDNNNVISTNYYESTTNLNGNHWKVNWDEGVTEGGSSGSPLFDENHRIIGQLHGGNASCLDPNAPDWYGKFSTSWVNGGLDFYLDINNTDQTTINTYCISNNEDIIIDGTIGGGTDNDYTPDCRSIGFSVNEKTDDIVDVCLEYDILISAIPQESEFCSYGLFKMVNETVYASGSSECDDLEGLNDYYQFLDPTNFFNITCHANYKKLHLSIQEYGYNLVPIGIEFAEWISFGPEIYIGDPVTNSVGGFDGHDHSRLINFHLQDYMPSGSVLQNGKIYRVKISTVSSNGWEEYSRFIKTYNENDLFVENGLSSSINNLQGLNITFENSTIINYVDAVAVNSININSETSLLSGYYHIGDILPCVSFKSMMLSPTSSVEELDYKIIEKKELKENKKFIYPNPSKGTLNLCARETINNGAFKYFVYSINGKLIKEGFGKTKIELSLANGIYIVYIYQNDFSYSEKIIIY